MTSLFAALLSFHNVLARYYFALGNSGALPAACGRSHPRHTSPHIASLTQTRRPRGVHRGVRAGRDGPGDPGVRLDGGHRHPRCARADGADVRRGASCSSGAPGRRAAVAHRRRARRSGWSACSVCLWLTVSNFPTLIGGSPALATAIGAVLVLAFVLGAAWSRAARPIPHPSHRPAAPTPPTPPREEIRA